MGIPTMLVVLVPEGFRTTVLVPEGRAPIRYPLRNVPSLANEVPVLLRKWCQDTIGAGDMVLRHGCGSVVLPSISGVGGTFIILYGFRGVVNGH